MGDQRIYKRYEGPGRIKVGKVLASSWHLRDAGGREVGVLDLETGRWAWYLFGAQRFARIQPNNGSQQPAFYSGDLGELGGLSQEGDEYQGLLDLLLELAGADEELDYPLTVHRVVLTGGAVLFLSDTAWSALQGQGTPVDDEEPWTFTSGTNEVTVAHAGGSVTLSIEALLGEGAHGGAPNANGFWYIYPADTTLHSVTYYEHDHLGNLRVAHTPMLSCTEDAPPVMDVAGSSYRLEHVLDYYPYGKVLKEYVNSGGPERYLTTQHERDQETGLDYRGARYYDADVARFLSLDPLAADYASWSAYNYVMGNPLSLIDPTGRSAWHPDGDGNLVADEGDNAQTLAKYENISYGKALEQLKGQGYETNEQGILDLKVGDKLKMEESSEWYGTGGQVNWISTAIAGGVEYGSGISRVGSNLRFYGSTANGGVFFGNQYVKTFSLSKAGGMLGKACFGAGIAMDAFGVLQWAQDSNSPNAVHPAKAGLNTYMGALAFTGVGAIPSAAYFAVDSFYPGGWSGYFKDYDQHQKNVREIIPGFVLAPYGSQKF